MAITTLYRDLLLEYAKSIASKSILTVDGEEKEYPIYKTNVEDGIVKHFIYPDDVEDVEITKAQLFDAFGRELQYREFSVKKGQDGFAIVFVTNIKIVEAV